jgi:hypothetical protein
MNPAGRVPELLREREFRRYWSAQTISMFGDQVSSVAIPYTGIIIGALFASEFFSGVGVMILDISIGSIFAASSRTSSGPGSPARSRPLLRHPPGGLARGRCARHDQRHPAHPVDRGHRRPYRVPVAAAFTIARFPVAARKYS